jgi:hypothetical protein
LVTAAPGLVGHIDQPQRGCWPMLTSASLTNMTIQSVSNFIFQ